MQMGANATVLGASGYAGGELLRLLTHHPVLTVGSVAAGRSVGVRVGEVHPHLRRWDARLLSIGDALAADADVVFSCLPSGELGPWLEGLDGPVVIDLSDEHRAAQDWLYGLTEFVRPAFPAAAVANPGCYPTAALLALVPLARAGTIRGPVVVDAFSGTSGAGRDPSDRLLHGSVAGNVSAYGGVDHRHLPEIERGLAAFGGLNTAVSFTPHLVPLTRGLVVTARAALAADLDDAEALDVLHDAYDDEPFVDVVEGWPGCAGVAGTNQAVVSARVDARAGWLIASAAIDNLGKGAAGQALQNANLCLGLDETLGLDQTAAWP